MAETRVDLPVRHLRELRRLVAESGIDPAGVYVFGSRAQGGARRWSDVDLALGDVGEHETSALAERLEDSELPYRVDIVRLAVSSESLRAKVARHGIALADR